MAGKLKFKTCFTMHVQCTYPYLIFSRVFGIFVETFALGEKRMKTEKHERTNWGHYFYVSYWRRGRHFTWSSEPREGLGICRTKAVPSFLIHF